MPSKKPGPKRRAEPRIQRRPVESPLDAALKRWWTGYGFPTDRSDRELLALGEGALERLLDCADGNAQVDVEQDHMNYRDYGDWRAAGLCAFAKADPAGVLVRARARGWDARRIAWCLGAVPDPRFLPYVLAELQSPSSLERVAAVNHLALHRDPRATEALLGALKDRSSFVRFCALEALGHAGDPRAVDPLRRFAKEIVASKRDVHLADAARDAIKRIRSAGTQNRAR
jgi:hypothetical protein